MTPIRNAIRLSAIALVLAPIVLHSQSGLAEQFPWFVKPRRQPVYPELGLAAEGLQRALQENGAIALDLRPAAEFRAGHVPGAVRIELGAAVDVTAIRAELAAAGVCGQAPVVLYGEDASLLAVAPAFLRLAAAGIGEPRLLLGGFRAWSASGRLTETATSPRPPCSFAAPAPEGIFVDRSWVAKSFDRQDVEIADLRGPAGWESGSYETPPLYGAGHVPHSLPLAAGALLAPDGGFLPPEAARKILHRLGPRPGTTVRLDSTFVLVGSAEDDPNPALAYLLLRAMDVDAKVLAGGYRSWTEGEGSPVVRIVSTEELRRSLESPAREEIASPVVFDLREDWDYREGHLPGAESLPSREFAAQIEERIGKLGRPVDRARTPLVFYCYGRECIRSYDCSAIAARHGFLNLLWYREDVVGWEREGGAVVGPDDAEKSRATAALYKALGG